MPIPLFWGLVWSVAVASGGSYSRAAVSDGPRTGRTPRWEPQWDMALSTIFMPCNDSGFHDVGEALGYGIVSYDWSNAKQLWANNYPNPMNDEALLTRQAEMVLAADTKRNRTKVWIYRNTIKALNWFGSVREKLDDPDYAGWFIRFRDNGTASNYSQPACDTSWHPQKCSGFWHDQAQSPGYPKGDGNCDKPCYCGVNPCGEYIFDHRNATFAKWFLDHWMVSNETLGHPGIYGLLLDDHMLRTGPTETHGHFLADTGLTDAEMEASVTAYNANMLTLWDTIVEHGGFAWDLFGGEGTFYGVKSKQAQCLSELKEICSSRNKNDGQAQFYKMSPSNLELRAGGARERDGAGRESEIDEDLGAQYTAAFLLSRGKYAWIGFEWAGCRTTRYPRPAAWDVDYGLPIGNCTEASPGSGTYVRHFTKATVTWDCSIGAGNITMVTE